MCNVAVTLFDWRGSSVRPSVVVDYPQPFLIQHMLTKIPHIGVPTRTRGLCCGFISDNSCRRSSWVGDTECPSTHVKKSYTTIRNVRNVENTVPRLTLLRMGSQANYSTDIHISVAYAARFWLATSILERDRACNMCKNIISVMTAYLAVLLLFSEARLLLKGGVCQIDLRSLLMVMI